MQSKNKMSNGASEIINKNTDIYPTLMDFEIDQLYRSRLEDFKPL